MPSSTFITPNYWRHGGQLKETKTEVSAKPLPMHPTLKNALAEWMAQTHYSTAGENGRPVTKHSQQASNHKGSNPKGNVLLMLSLSHASAHFSGGYT
jgi:hypothetical protein